MIVFTLRVVVPPARRVEVFASAGGLLGPTRVQPGCRGCYLYVDVEDPNAVMLVEEWESRATLDRHLASDASKTVVALMELSTEAPAVRFDTVAMRAGVELIAEARGAHGARDA